MAEGLILSGFVLVVVAAAMAFMWRRRKRAEQRGNERLKLAQVEGQTIPTSLHPVIDPVLCVGSFSCTKVCPEGDVLGVVDGVASLIESEKCIGHARCAVECPVGAIKLVYGTAEVGIDLPRTDESFESGRPGVYVIGELAGMGLIKNCLRQGLSVGAVLKKRLGKSEATETITDVAIVGGGPAGIAAAVACRRQGLDVRVLEQDSLGGCIANYPRGKVVMSERVEMPGFGPFGRSLLSKEELLADLKALVVKNGVQIEEGQKVVSVDGNAGKMTVTTEKGGVVACRAVVLAVGLRGTPKKLEVTGEALSKVTYRLIEPEQYNGKRVLVVGGGDSAVEAAIQLAEESSASVTISYRQDRFSRCKQRNRDKIMQLINDGQVRVLWKTAVSSIDDKYVHLSALDAKGQPIAPPSPSPSSSSSPSPSSSSLSLSSSSLSSPSSSSPSLSSEASGSASSKPSAPPSTTVLSSPFELPPTIAAPSPLLEEARATNGSGSVKKPDPEVTDPLGALPNLRIRMPVAEDTKRRRGSGTSITGKRSVRPLGDRIDDPSGAVFTMPREQAAVAVAPPAASAIGGAIASSPGGSAFGGIPVTDIIEPHERTRTFFFKAPEEPPKVVERKVEKKEKTSTKSSSKDAGPGVVRLRNDAVIVSIGGQLPAAFLSKVGVTTRNYRGEEKTGMGRAPGKTGPSKAQVEARQRRRLALILSLLGVSIIVSLFLMGPEYYWLPADQRSTSQLHFLLKPSGLWGHGIGVVATLFMLANFLYAVRKRWRAIKGKASIRTWLTFHMFVGIMSPLVIAFHAAFLLNNLLAVWTWIALSVVVGTGIFGRFLFGFVPAQAGKVMQVAELREQVSEMTRVVQTHMAEAKDFGRVAGLFDRATEAPRERTVVAAVLRENTQRKKVEREMGEVKELFKTDDGYKSYKDAVEKVARARMQIAFYGNLKRIFRGWLVIHVVISIFMVVLIGAHVGVTTYYGFRWVFSSAPP